MAVLGESSGGGLVLAMLLKLRRKAEEAGKNDLVRLIDNVKSARSVQGESATAAAGR
jgi:acetyl esterase/lipase